MIETVDRVHSVTEDGENTHVRCRDEKRLHRNEPRGVRRAREHLGPELSLQKPTGEHNLKSIHLQTDTGNGTC
jgi:hypothetical protein